MLIKETSLRHRLVSLLLILALSVSLLAGCSASTEDQSTNEPVQEQTQEAQTTEEQSQKIDASTYTLDNIPAYSGSPYVEINGNVPNFTD